MVKKTVKLTELYLNKVNMAITKYKIHTSIKAIQNTMVELNNYSAAFYSRRTIRWALFAFLW